MRQQRSRNRIVAVRKNVGFHANLVAHGSFGRKRPQSTCGVIPSMMTRLRPSDRFCHRHITFCKFSLLRITGTCHVRPLDRLWPRHFAFFCSIKPLVQVDRLMRNRRPTEYLFHPPPARIAKSPALLRILQQ